LKLTGALLNLVGNAGDALSPGGRLTLSTRRIRFADDIMGCSMAYASNGCALISISDTGAGMDQSIRERIFEPFFTTKEGCRGLGCTLARRIVESLNGRISVESAVDAGTDVRVYLPLIKNDLMRAIPIALPASFSASPLRSIYR
jgi:signal transduction histidine kinase